MAEMVAYCEQDVRAMRVISQAQRPLTADELADYHVNERINDRGVLLDRPLALAAVRYSDAESADIQQTVEEITGGEIKSVRSPKMRRGCWIASGRRRSSWRPFTRTANPSYPSTRTSASTCWRWPRRTPMKSQPMSRRLSNARTTYGRRQLRNLRGRLRLQTRGSPS
jgi:hypothetical protein